MRQAVTFVVILGVFLAVDFHSVLAAAAEPTFHDVGLAKVDITPDYNIRLSGFAGRLTESVGVRDHIFARAMAIRASNGGEPVVLVTVDSIGVPLHVRNEVAQRLLAKKKIANERFASVCHAQPFDAGVSESVAHAVRCAGAARAAEADRALHERVDR